MRTFKKLPVVSDASEPPRGRRHPDWIKVRIPSGENYFDVRELVHGLELHTVCESASCPNI
ncbi:MAG TPA: lipoyl synthase, partial [Polyangia bacterium]